MPVGCAVLGRDGGFLARVLSVVVGGAFWGGNGIRFLGLMLNLYMRHWALRRGAGNPQFDTLLVCWCGNAGELLGFGDGGFRMSVLVLSLFEIALCRNGVLCHGVLLDSGVTT